METREIWEELVEVIVHNERTEAHYRKMCDSLEDARYRATCKRIADELERLCVGLRREFNHMFPELNLDELIDRHLAVREKQNTSQR